ncbi:biotin transporter BioY [Pectinatus sottacetonis]|uniref:biotin transporter BioY n=1 Tax=Pectinatus sottacetonis TaxID=1002795 RepID=UPI0018C6A1B1|nr:biotin transporter BioY [Pectinatus sottacetonis]
MSSTRNIAKMAVCVAIICISAYLSFPLPFTTVPFTFLTLSMLLTSFILPPWQTFITLTVYVLLGSAGLPVFANGSSGIGVLFSPNGGYLIGFIIAYPICSFLKGTPPNLRRYFAAGLISIPISYIFGVIGICLTAGLSVTQAVFAGVLPFLIGDIIKDFLAAYIGVHLKRLLP